MKKILLYAIIFAFGFLTCFLLRGCGDKPKDNTTNNAKNALDSLKIVQDYPHQIAVKEVIIQDLTKTVADLESQSKEKGDLADELASKIRKYQQEIKRLGGELLALQFIVSETKTNTTAPIEVIQRTDEAGVEIGGEPIYSAVFKDSTEWYKAAVYFDLVTKQGTMNLVTRNEFAISDYIGSDGVEYMRVNNLNPHSITKSGTNLFKKPTPLPTPPKKNLLVGLYGRSTDGVPQYSILYGRRFLKHGKVLLQGVYDRDRVAGMAGLGLDF